MIANFSFGSKLTCVDARPLKCQAARLCDHRHSTTAASILRLSFKQELISDLLTVDALGQVLEHLCGGLPDRVIGADFGSFGQR